MQETLDQVNLQIDALTAQLEHLLRKRKWLELAEQQKRQRITNSANTINPAI